ncbi:alkaline phosphatase D family protein [Arthrobacter oryzae]|uniref:alkaline phosphatase D family protein n=1 Tax=Arthrobacter oryzae TaxID=409290 RepID=UPI002858DFA2|nr:alkaline phosphatase D family protein [Arthrobacter oryzae]MDR6507330.1 alkaline phosphatase D [Arthrobacter oryzae]
MTSFTRRNVLKGALAAAGAAAVVPSATAHATSPAGVALVRNRLTLPSGIATGDVTADSGVLWSRASGPGRLVANLLAVDDDGAPLRGGRAFQRVLRGSAGSEATDFTSRINAEHLPAGTRFALTLHFEDADGNAGEAAQGSFSTAPGTGLLSSGRAPRKQSFVWTGDTAGQGWGINEEIGGMRGYAAMHATKPDFFIHSGDTIYADGPIAARVTEPDGQIWRNLVTEEVSKVAETLNEYRGRHRYNLMDRNVRALYAEVPVIAQWDDHETTNNWYPGEILADARYTERRVDVLAARGRQAWQEYQPVSGLSTRIGDGSTGFEPARIYRKISRGPQLEVFCLDMRTFKDPNTDGKETTLTHILGEEQVQWLIREVSKSRATWKVISADLPLGLIVPDGPVNQESLANRDHGAPLGKELEIAGVLSAFKRNRVKNVVWLTADVHYCAAHHYSPERAGFTDFDPFWEFVAGPINAGSFGPGELDGTFGPERVFYKTGAYAGQSPRTGENQFFGHVDLTEDDVFSVSLRNANGTVLWSKALQPQR